MYDVYYITAIGCLILPAPMPRLVADPVAVFTGIGETETELGRMFAQPVEGGSPPEIRVETDMPGRAEIERPAAVMLAVAWGGDESQDFVERLTRGSLSADDRDLPCDTAKAREWEQFDTIAGGGGLHASPGTRDRGCQPNGLPVVGRRSHRHEALRFAVQRQMAFRRVVRGDAEAAMQRANARGIVRSHGARTWQNAGAGRGVRAGPAVFFVPA